MNNILCLFLIHPYLVSRQWHLDISSHAVYRRGLVAWACFLPNLPFSSLSVSQVTIGEASLDNMLL